MRIKLRLGRIPDGDTPLANQSVAVRRLSDGLTLATLTSDANGFITWQTNGHPEPFFLHLQEVPGGDKFWRSDESKTSGVISPRELPAVLRALGDGVVRGYASQLAVTLSGGGPGVNVAAGAANVVGHPFVTYGTLFLDNSRPLSGTRIDRVVIQLWPEGSATTPGLARLGILSGVVGSGVPPALTQTATLHEVSLAQISVPSAGTITLTDERAFAGEMLPVSGVVRQDSASTTNGSGEALVGLSIPLVLPRAGDYTITAALHALQVAVSAEWTLLGTFTVSAPNFNTPAQVAVDPTTGKIWVADTGNARAVRLTAAGAFDAQITGLTGITGVAVGPDGFLYVCGSGATIRTFSPALTEFPTVALPANGKHLAIAGTDLCVTMTNNTVSRYASTSGGIVGTATTWGSGGSGNGQFTTPWGIAAGGGEVYVVDQGNRVQVFTTSGTFLRKWTTGSGRRGIALDSGGDVWVVNHGFDTLAHYTNTGTLLETITQADADGIAAASGDVLWASNAVSNNVVKYDEAGGGNGQVAIDIGGSLSDYTGIGERMGSIGSQHSATVTGPATVTIRAFGKATSGQMSLASLVLSAEAKPRH